MASSAGDTVIITSSVRQRFSSGEIAEAHADFVLDGPSLYDEETGQGVGVYEPGPGRVLFVVEKDDFIEILAIEDFGLSKHYPPERGNLGFPTGLVILAALGGSLGAILLPGVGPSLG
jgi:hypothetical protein